MTQPAVERALGKLLTDEAFRAWFFAAPAEACRQAGLVLAPVELDALTRLSREELDRLAESIDARISRPCLDPTSPDNTNHWRER